MCLFHCSRTRQSMINLSTRCEKDTPADLHSFFVSFIDSLDSACPYYVHSTIGHVPLKLATKVKKSKSSLTCIFLSESVFVLSHWKTLNQLTCLASFSLSLCSLAQGVCESTLWHFVLFVKCSIKGSTAHCLPPPPPLECGRAGKTELHLIHCASFQFISLVPIASWPGIKVNKLSQYKNRPGTL